jgi:hypothetical protein
VLTTLAVCTGSSYVLVVIPAACRLDLQLARKAVGDNHARLASEEELDRRLRRLPVGRPASTGGLGRRQRARSCSVLQLLVEELTGRPFADVCN